MGYVVFFMLIAPRTRMHDGGKNVSLNSENTYVGISTKSRYYEEHSSGEKILRFFCR